MNIENVWYDYDPICPRCGSSLFYYDTPVSGPMRAACGSFLPHFWLVYKHRMRLLTRLPKHR